MEAPLVWLALAFLGGLALGDWLPWSWPVWVAAALASIPLILFLRRQLNSLQRLPGAIVFLVPILLFGGALRYQLAHQPPTPQDLAWYNGRGPLALTGLIVTPPEPQGEYTYLRIQIEQAAPPADAALAATSPILSAQPLKGMLLAAVLPGGDWQYGDRVTLTGAPVSPPVGSGFSFQDYLARQGIYTYLAYPQVTRLASGQGNIFWAWLYRFKAQALAVVYRIFPQPESALMAGILLGDASRLSPGLQQAYQATGTAHIIAISGFNIAILAGLFSMLFSRLLGARRGAIAAGLAITFYTLLVGANPSVVRAAIMGCLGLFARQIGRRQMGLNSLAATAGVMCLADPNLPWNVSFQLTFMATLGLILYATPFSEAFTRLAGRLLPAGLTRRLAGPVGEYILFSLAAQIATFPVMVYHFQNFSLVSLLANPLVLPPQPLVEVLGGLALVGGLIHPAIGQALGYLAWPFVAYTNRMVAWLGSIPHGLLSIGATSPWVWAAFYALLFGLTFFKLKPRVDWPGWLRKALTPQVGLAACAVVVVLAWSAVRSTPDGQLHLTLFEGGAPGTLLVQTPGGRWIVIAGGPLTSQISQEIGQRLPLFNRQVDLLVVAIPKDTDLPGLALSLDDFPIQQAVWARGSAATGQGATALQQALTQRQIPLATAVKGEVFDLGSGASLSVAGQPATGTVLLLSWGSFHALLPVGTIDDTGQTLASASTGPVNVLMLEGSGAAASNPAAVVTTLHPQALMLDPDINGCPAACAPVVELAGYTLLRTDQSGWIEVSTDGEKMWVEGEKGQ